MANRTRILDSALSTCWAITEDGLHALREIYSQALERGGSQITEDQLRAIIEDNEDLSSSLHMRSGPGNYSVLNATRVEGTKYGYRLSNGVAILELVGPIFPRANLFTAMSGATSIQQFVSDFMSLYDNDDIRGIVMDVDSPGGDVRGIGDAANLINKVTRTGTKPVRAFASGLMASAGYYIGSSVGKGNVIGSESSLSGSIGVVLTGKSKASGEIEIVSSKSPKKRANPETEEGVAVLQQRVDDLADVFIRDISKFRSVTSDVVEEKYGQGDVFVGPRAKKQGLIDSIGILSEVVGSVGRVSQASKTTKASVSYPAILKFTEEEKSNMGLQDIISRFTASADTEENEQGPDTTAAEESEQVDAVEESDGPGSLPTVTREELSERFSDSAELFATQQLIDDRIVPAQQGAVAADFLIARIDDAMYGGTVEYVAADGTLKTGTREDAVRARYSHAPKHNLRSQSVPVKKDGTQSVQVLAETDEDTETVATVSDERRKQLLGLSSQGQAVLAQK